MSTPPPRSVVRLALVALLSVGCATGCIARHHYVTADVPLASKSLAQSPCPLGVATRYAVYRRFNGHLQPIHVDPQTYLANQMMRRVNAKAVAGDIEQMSIDESIARAKAWNANPTKIDDGLDGWYARSRSAENINYWINIDGLPPFHAAMAAELSHSLRFMLNLPVLRAAALGLIGDHIVRVGLEQVRKNDVFKKTEAIKAAQGGTLMPFKVGGQPKDARADPKEHSDTHKTFDFAVVNVYMVVVGL